MEKFKNIVLKSLPALVAVILFGVVSLVGFAPQLEGKVLPQHDIRQFDGMSRDIRECRADYDEDPQWTGAMFSGMPAYQINIKYPAQIIKRTFDSVQSLFTAPASMVFFAMLAAFVMALLKMVGNPEFALSDLLNSDKALTVIVAIFVSVAIAFLTGTLVQWLARIVFSFNLSKRRPIATAIFGGISFTVLTYFIFIKGLFTSLDDTVRKEGMR